MFPFFYSTKFHPDNSRKLTWYYLFIFSMYNAQELLGIFLHNIIFTVSALLYLTSFSFVWNFCLVRGWMTSGSFAVYLSNFTKKTVLLIFQYFICLKKLQIHLWLLEICILQKSSTMRYTWLFLLVYLFSRLFSFILLSLEVGSKDEVL